MPTPRSVRFASILCLAALVLAACGDDSSSGASETGAAPTSTPTTTAPAPTFPITVTAENGPVELAAQPLRIVSLSASLTELLFAVGAGDQVVAVDEHSDFPTGTPVTDLSGFRPNIEAIAGQQPDLVVLARDRDGVVEALTGLGIPTLLLSSADSLDDVYAQIAVLGDATGHPAESAALVDDVRSRLDELAGAVPERAAPLRYFYELSDELHSITSETFVGELLSLAGMVSIADGVDDAAGGFPQLSNEFVLSADPDVILLAHTDGSGLDPTEVAARPGWAALGAVEDGDVVVLDGDISSRWGPRIVELLQAVVDATTGIQ